MARTDSRSSVYWPTLQEINEMGEWALRIMWRSLPRRPANDEQRDVLERLAVRCEALGMVGADGELAS